jgi:hypothetical protein
MKTRPEKPLSEAQGNWCSSLWLWRTRGKPLLTEPFAAQALKERIAAISAELRKERASPQA